MATTTKRNQLEANKAKLAAYLDEKPESAMKRKKLTDKMAAYEDALQVHASSTHCLSHAICVPGCLFARDTAHNVFIFIAAAAGERSLHT